MPSPHSQGTASGTLWNDTIILAGHNLTNQTVALVDQVSDALLGGNASGIMGVWCSTILKGVGPDSDGLSCCATGLGFPALAASGITPYWVNLMEDNQTEMDFRGFSFYLTRYINATNTSVHIENG